MEGEEMGWFLPELSSQILCQRVAFYHPNRVKERTIDQRDIFSDQAVILKHKL